MIWLKPAPGCRGEHLIRAGTCMQCMPNATKRNRLQWSSRRLRGPSCIQRVRGPYSRAPMVNQANRTQMMRALLALREQILSGEFKPGERLGVSRTPLRLALASLEHEGLLQVLPTGGYVVREFTLTDIRQAIELRGVLEGTACRFAAEHGATRRDLRALREINDAVEPLVHRADYESFERYVALNATFHDRLIKMAHSPLLERTLATVLALPF